MVPAPHGIFRPRDRLDIPFGESRRVDVELGGTLETVVPVTTFITRNQLIQGSVSVFLTPQGPLTYFVRFNSSKISARGRSISTSINENIP
jgi:hypothetical protein